MNSRTPANWPKLAWRFGWPSARRFLPSTAGCSRLSPATAGSPRSLDAARAKAVELVGQAKFDAAQADPWIDRYMQTSIRIYGGTIQNGNNAVPKLVFGSRWVTPEPNDADDLVLICMTAWRVPKP